MVRRKIYSPQARMRIAVKMEIYLERRIAANPKLPMIKIVEAEYAKFDASPKTFLVKMLLGWDKYGDKEKFDRYLSLVLEQTKYPVESSYLPSGSVATGIIENFPICFGYPSLTRLSFPSDSPVYVAAAHRYDAELSHLFEVEPYESHWHPDDPTSWDPDDYMDWEIDRLLDKPD